MPNDQRFESRYTGEEMESAFSVALAIANHAGIPKGTGKGSIQILSMDTDRLTSDGERIPTSAVVAQAIAAARKVSELLVFKGIVQTTDDLPADAKPGFVYIVAQKDNENYAWDGVGWTPIGKLIAPIILSSQSASYQIGDSGDAIPTGVWIDAIPSVPQGKYLWTRMEVQLSVGDPVVWYSVAYSGVDGKALTAADVGALALSGGDMEGPINMNGQPISGLNPPTEATQAANKGYVDTTTVSLSLPASGWVGDSAPYTQTIAVDGLTDGRQVEVHPAYGDDIDANLAMRQACGFLSYAKREGQNVTFTCLEDKPAVDIGVIAKLYV